MSYYCPVFGVGGIHGGQIGGGERQKPIFTSSSSYQSQLLPHSGLPSL